MIRVSSLDFLDQDCFRTDIKTADGKIIINSGEPITPELILKLYFKEIYVEEPTKVIYKTDEHEEKALREKIKESNVSFVSKNEDTVDVEVSIKSTEKTSVDEVASVTKENQVINEDLQAPQLDITENSKVKEPQAPQLDFTPTAKSEPEVVSPVLDINFSETPKPNVERDKEELPIQEEVVVAKEEIPFEDQLIVVDENEVELLVERTAQLAKMFNFSGAEIEEIKLAARYANMSLSEFKLKEINEKDFRLRKSKRSYDMACALGTLSQSVLETIKEHTKNYDSASFSLSSKIPYTDILSVTCYCFRAKLLRQDKETVLKKMLQLGSNSFNPFVLHKFIKMMRGL